MPQIDATVDPAGFWSAMAQALAGDPDVTGQLSGFIGLIHPKGAIGDTILLEVPDELAREMIEHRARDAMARALVAVQPEHQDITNFAVIVNAALRDLVQKSPQPRRAPSQHALDRAAEPVESTAAAHPAAAQQRIDPATVTPPAAPARPHQPTAVGGSRLNPKYTFDSFVIGASNRFAHAAAFAVAETPAKAYNPLFIYGESGLGKTHLLHAIGHYAISLFPGIRVLYVSSEEFTNDFINSIQRNEAAEFQSRYRDIDILLIDDIQFLQGKDSTQEAFFHTFNNLHDHNKQLVITSDLPPKQLTGFQERMTSRFEWGLTTDVQAPDLETRIAILRRKAENEQMDVPDEILELIASRVSSNIRELEGTLLRVIAYASIEQKPIDFALAQTALKDMITLADDNHVDPKTIIETTANYFSLSVKDIVGTSRSQQIALARQIAMYICRELTSLSLPKIGQLFGNRDHTTVMYANNKISRLMQEKRAIYNQVNDISTAVKQAHR
ncbi:chromosomal replication initiator protein [Pseudoclavibacter caeni]|jgi:chromosomal replication initiator protein|uniref:Chromosomal replication initiator protein DnaA n=1 Tax=Pseudoclavibacter caeni TaxID=908846 RepID=A0A7C8FY13_9MICO|nr:chromosomal replication initiator protein DnaA [Pseudoclavibacter caeni]NYJ96412.1 chromosomal replication initiator protein [Pseudoclavibacter caeni]